MAGLNTLKIIVMDGGKSDVSLSAFDRDADGSSSGGKKKNTNKDSALFKILNWNDTIKQKMVGEEPSVKSYALSQGIGLATQTAKGFINYYVSDIGRATGDSNYQAIVQRRIEQVTDVTGFATSALAGAAAGSIFGPIGALVGAAVGAAIHGISTGFKYAERDRAYQHEMFKENTSQAYNISRAGFHALTGRVR
jgi:hypothetical protein